MTRAGVIAGRVVDASGAPVSDTQVTAMRYRYVAGMRRLMLFTFSRTSDTGDFRLFDLPPGQYYIDAQTLDSRVIVNPNTREILAATYYPSATNLRDAETITIGPGQTIEPLNIRLRTTRTFTLSGLVVDSNGRPLAEALVQAGPRLSMAAGQWITSSVRPDGTFALTGLQPSEYVVHVSAHRIGREEFVAVPVDMTSGDVSRLRIVAPPPTPITGRVIIDPAELGATGEAPLRLSAMAARAEEASVDESVRPMAGSEEPATVATDFTFELKAAPGRVFIRSNSAGWFVKAVRVDGGDVADTAVDVRPNELLRGVEVELTRHQPDVAGTVRNADGTVIRAAYVIVFPRDRSLWGYLSRRVRMGRPDPDNQFHIQVPPGEYQAVAVDAVEPGAWAAPEFLERLADRAMAFTLPESGYRNLDLRITAAPKP